MRRAVLPSTAANVVRTCIRLRVIFGHVYMYDTIIR